MSEGAKDSQYPGADASLLREAEGHFRAAIAASPRTPDALHLLASAAHQAGLHPLAREILGEIFETVPDHPGAHNTMGRLQRDEGDYEAAIGSFQRAIALAPAAAERWADLAEALRRNGQAEESLAHGFHAVSLDGAHADSHHIVGNAFYTLGRFEDAMASFQRALALDPDHAGAHRSFAVICFLRGNFGAGYPHYEWRWRATGFRGTLENLGRPMWRGERLAGRTLLIHAEQGLGDTLQFVRYVALIERDGGRIILQVQRGLKRLLAGLEDVEVVARGEVLPAFDVQCPMLSLPGILGTTHDTIPRDVPYLSVDAGECEKWKARLGPAGKLRVGVAWAGNRLHSGDRYRSIPFALWAPLLEMERIEFHSLQKQELEKRCGHERLIDHSEAFGDFAETAAYVAGLDLVITVDTAVAHLAGSMGKEAWVMLPVAPDWRWMLERGDSPWYAGMRLFRQRVVGAWGGVIEEVRWALMKRLHLKASK